MSEDCLTLNVYTSGDGRKKPVYVFIHGGSFVSGSNREDDMGGVYCGDRLVSANPDIVYVNINYRLGVFGNLDLSVIGKEDEYPDARNIMTLDWIRALEWIHENIEAFGGNPENVTIGGQSAGGAAVLTLTLIPEARKYFKRAICESCTLDRNLCRTIERRRTRRIMIAGIAAASDLNRLKLEQF